MSAQQEEAQKEKLLTEQKEKLEEEIRQMAALQKMTVTKTMEDKEYFIDNSTVIKHETAKLEQASKEAEEAGHQLEEMIPKL